MAKHKVNKSIKEINEKIKSGDVVVVTAGGPAARAGLIAADPQNGRGGDLIVDIDGRPIGDFSDLNGYLVFDTRVGQTIQITVLRDGEQVVIPLELGARP